MIRVLNITSTPSAAGGAERLLLDMAHHHDRSSFTFSWCNLFFGASSFAEALRDAGEDLTVIPGLRPVSLPRVLAQLVTTIRRSNPDIVHTHMLHATIAGHLAAALARVPARIVTRHYTDELMAGPLRAAERFALRRATRVIGVSAAVEANLRAAGVRPGAISVIHNGIDLQRFEGERSRDADLPWPHDWIGVPLIGSVGNFFSYKGYDVLLRAFALIVREEPRARLVVIGEGRERESLIALARELSIATQVALPGSRADVPALLRSFSVYVQPSRSESFGIAAAEAMAAGLPVVATTAGGLPELVSDAGLLVPPGDPGELAAAILRLLRDREAAQAMGERARARVQAKFSIAATVRQTEAIYGDVAR